MRNFYSIEIINHEESVLFYPNELDLKTANLVAFGSLSVPAAAYPQKSKKRKISISKPLANQLYLPDLPLKLHIFEHNGTLFLGPVVGIFTAGFTSFSQSPVGNRSYFFSKLLSLYDQVGVFPFVFGVQHIQWEKGTVNGLFYHHGEWMSIEVPIPNVIYDRLPNRKVENLKMIQDLKSKLAEEYAIPWYNPGFFNKLEIYNKLKKSSTIREFLPKTVPFSNKDSLQKMLDEFGYIYIKPNNGSLGNEVYKVRKTKSNIYICRFRDEFDQNRLMKFSSLNGLYKKLFAHKNVKHYILQQGIALLKNHERPADFRIHTNKDQNGKWKVTVIACKVAGLGSATTHKLSGGTVQSMDEFFQNEEERKTNQHRLSETALIISEELEKHYNGVLAEIGFDFGIDEDGDIWMFEANSKPGRAIFLHPKLRKYERNTYKLILAFAVYLTEKVIYEPESIFHELVLQ